MYAILRKNISLKNRIAMKKKKVTKAFDSFFLRSRKREGAARLYYRVRRNGRELTLRTNITVDIELWSEAIQSATAWRRYTQDQVLTGRDGELRLMRSEGGRVAQAMAALAEGLRQMAAIDDRAAVEQLVERVRAGRSEGSLGAAAAYRTGGAGGGLGMEGIVAFYDFFVKGITSGLIRHHKGKRYSERSIGVWREFGPVLRGYVDSEQTFGDIDRLFIDGFRLSLEQRGLMETTIEEHMACFRKLCRSAAEYGQNHNALSLTGWHCHRVKSEQKRAEIYLTETEIDELYRMPLPEKALDEVRDLFVLGYLSFQRWSDFSRLDATNFIVNSEGVRVMALRQRKTGMYVEVPVTDERVNGICRKYGYEFPRVSRKRMNELLKIVMRRLAERLPSMRERYVTVLTAQERRAEEDFGRLVALVEHGGRLTDAEWRRYRRLRHEAERRGGMPLYARNAKGQVVREKFELVTTHTARRSGITNVYKNGLLDNRQMMALSGHQTERVLEEYIKVGPAEQAKRIFERLRRVNGER